MPLIPFRRVDNGAWPEYLLSAHEDALLIDYIFDSFITESSAAQNISARYFISRAYTI